MATENPWIEWTGGDCPVPLTSDVDVRFDDGVEIGGVSAAFWAGDNTAGDPNWWSGRNDTGNNIIAYRAQVSA